MKEEPEQSKLSIKKRENEGPMPSGPTIPCPSCNARIEEDAVICTKCGFNLKSGKKLRTSRGRGKKIARDLILMLVVLGALAWLVSLAIKHLLPKQEDAAEKVTSTLSAVKEQAVKKLEESGVKELAEEAKTAARDTSRDIKRDILKKEVPEVPAPAKVDPPPAKASTNVAPSSSESAATISPPPLSLEQLARSMKEQLETKYPFAKTGDEIILKTSTGQTVRGQVVKLDETEVMLHTEAGARKMPYASLHRGSRVRCDAIYRKAYLERLIQKKREAAAAQEATTP